MTGDGARALTALRAIPADTLLENASAKDEIEAVSAGRHVAGFAGAIGDGKLVVDA